MQRKKYKVMAYVLSTGLWDGFGCVTLDQVLGLEHTELASDLAAWQAEYDAQFMRYPHAFDWKRFNARGEQLAARIKEKLSAECDVYYEPSDDREFFIADDGKPAEGNRRNAILNELALRDRKRTLLHIGLGSSLFMHGR